jgi:hypothetical protein
MSNFASLKKSSSDLSRLTKEIEKINSPEKSTEREEDTRFWKLERDKSGNGSAIIRFLPTAEVDGDSLPWVRYFDHGFKGPTGKWYIENSLTTLNQKDPVGEYNTKLWGDGSIKDDSYRRTERKQAREQKRRLHYISNILVISDPKNPENEGKVFLFKYGKKIFDKISLAMNPEFEGDKPVNPFDLWKGANFKIRIRTVDGYPNYDQSVWDVQKPLGDDDAELEAIWKKEYSLKEFTDPKNFKSYDALKKRLDEVLGFDSQITDSVTSGKTTTDAILERNLNVVQKEKSEDVFKAASKRQSVDDDEDLEYFKSLADD